MTLSTICILCLRHDSGSGRLALHTSSLSSDFHKLISLDCTNVLSRCGPLTSAEGISSKFHYLGKHGKVILSIVSLSIHLFKHLYLKSASDYNGAEFHYLSCQELWMANPFLLWNKIQTEVFPQSVLTTY